MTLREQFEAWASAVPREYPLERTAHGTYKNYQVHNMWIGWEAACGQLVPDKSTTLPALPLVVGDLFKSNS